MMKITIIKGVIVTLSTLMLVGCSTGTTDSTTKPTMLSSTSENVTQTDYVKINGIYVDNSYSDSDNPDMKMVYLFYDVFTNSENLRISSKNSKITINGINSYSSLHYPGICKLMESYYYSDYIKDVYVGNTLKVVSTFNIPSSELESGRDLAITPYGIPDADKLKMTTDNIFYCNSPDEIAQTIDPDGYASYQQKYTEADEATTNSVRACLNGYYLSFYVNSTYYELEFYDPNIFELRTSIGTTTGGTYVVRNGFISVTNDIGNTTDIPWSWKDGEVDLETTTAYDVLDN